MLKLIYWWMSVSLIVIQWFLRRLREINYLMMMLHMKQKVWSNHLIEKPVCLNWLDVFLFLYKLQSLISSMELQAYLHTCVWRWAGLKRCNLINLLSMWEFILNHILYNLSKIETWSLVKQRLNTHTWTTALTPSVVGGHLCKSGFEKYLCLFGIKNKSFKGGHGSF